MYIKNTYPWCCAQAIDKHFKGSMTLLKTQHNVYAFRILQPTIPTFLYLRVYVNNIGHILRDKAPYSPVSSAYLLFNTDGGDDIIPRNVG